MQYACGVQCDPVCNHGSERISFWRQLYKPSAPLRVLLSALKASFAIHQLFAGGLSQLLLLCIHTPTPGCSPREICSSRKILPSAACPESRLCHQQQKRLRSVTCYFNMHPWHLFFSLTFFFTWPKLILSLSASHLDQIPLQLPFSFWPFTCQPPQGLCKSLYLKTTLSVPDPMGSQRTKKSELLFKETAQLRVPLLRMLPLVCRNLNLSINEEKEQGQN